MMMTKSLLLDEERLARLNIHIRWVMALMATGVWALCWWAELPIPHGFIAQSWLTLLLGNVVLRMCLGYMPSHASFIIKMGLILDCWVLTELLYLTGGAANPLTFLYLVPVLFAALLCSAAFAWGITFVTIALYVLIYFRNLPLVNPTWLHENMQLHFIGMWLTFCISAVLISLLVTWLMKTLKEREIGLRLAYQKQMRDENLLWLGMNAANLAHQLSTPMNNLYLLLDELRAQDHPQIKDDVELMHTQLDECRHILHALRQERHDAGEKIEFHAQFKKHLQEWQNLRPQVKLSWQQQTAEPLYLNIDGVFWPAVLNILNNAADAGDNQVEMTTSVQDAHLVIEIINRSGSLPQEHLEQAGLSALPSQKPSGLGLGMKLSYATFEKLGGSLSLSNQQQGGVQAIISLPLSTS